MNFTTERTLNDWEPLFETEIAKAIGTDDPAHDMAHVKRVVANAKRMAMEEGASLDIVVPAAWLHDLVNVPKDDPRRAQASRLSAEAALRFLQSVHYPESLLPGIAHAIEAHSFSANIMPKSVEAQVVQDADRLDGIGAIGIARVFVVAGLLKRSIAAPEDPLCKSRTPDDAKFTIDHFYRKLIPVANSLRTKSGQREGARRLQVMETYLAHLKSELSTD